MPSSPFERIGTRPLPRDIPVILTVIQQVTQNTRYNGEHCTKSKCAQPFERGHATPATGRRRRINQKGPTMAQTDSHRIVITVLGKNRAGIVAAISKILGEANVDIRDITQSIIEDIFAMTMLADMSESPMDFTALQEALAAGGEAVGVTVTIQREDVFNFMYRL